MLRCAWCHADLAAPVPCPGCSTALHRECWTLATTCPTLGCRERATARRPQATVHRPPAVSGRKILLALLFVAGICLFWPSRGSLWELETMAGDAGELAFTSDGRHVVALCGAGLRVADLVTGQWIRYPDTREVDGLAVSPDAAFVAAGRSVWHVDDLYGQPSAPRARLPGAAAAWAPDGRVIACVASDGTVIIADMSGRSLRSLDPGPPPPTDANRWRLRTCRYVGWSADGTRIAAGTPLGARVWDAATGQLLLDLRDVAPLDALQLSADGATLAGVTRGRFVHWSVPAGSEVMSLVLVEEDRGDYWGSFAISPDLRACAHDRSLGRLNLGITVHRLPPNVGRSLDIDGWATCMAFSADGAMLAVGVHGNRVQLWPVDR